MIRVTLSLLSARVLLRVASGESGGEKTVAALVTTGLLEATRPGKSGRMLAKPTAFGAVAATALRVLLNGTLARVTINIEGKTLDARYSESGSLGAAMAEGATSITIAYGQANEVFS